MKRTSKIILAIIMVIAIIAIIITYILVNHKSVESTSKASIQISNKELALEVEQSQNLSVTGTKSKIIWKSEDNAIATVSSKGKVTAKGIGKTTITASANGVKKSCTVTVTNKSSVSPTVTSKQITPTVSSNLVLPIAKNESGKVLIQTVSGSTVYTLNSYIISSAEGENVVIDPTEMPNKELVDLNPAAITNTHQHDDHNDSLYSATYDCPQLSWVKGELNTKDFHIYSILSSHMGDDISEYNFNVIIIYEVDGIRIAQMGDIGQTKLTKDQLKKMGSIDIAIMPFNNSYSDMSLENEKGFNLMAQLKPKIIIPMNDSKEDLAALKKHYGKIKVFENSFSISKDDLPSSKCNVYRITNTHKYK